jgi:hypothetical protein
MNIWPALLGGSFALLGVALQYGLASRTRQADHADAMQKTIWEKRIAAYAELVVDGRRVQRALKDEALAGIRTTESTSRIRLEMDRLAQSVAIVRLLGSPSVSEAVQGFEDQVGQAAALEPDQRLGSDNVLMQLGPLITLMQRETARG